MDRHFAAFAAAILVASLLFSLALAEDAPVDVCPANSAHKVKCTTLCCAGMLLCEPSMLRSTHQQHAACTLNFVFRCKLWVLHVDIALPQDN